MIIKHLPTGKTHQIKRQQENKIGLWYLSKKNVWIWAEDCMIVE